ncbi:MAG TPA: IS3 family transposase [Spirochaetota bacterium]|nr:IS3 family transposase [Spirochaetota bacterium]
MGGQRGRLISLEDKVRAVELVKEAMVSGASKSECCNILEISIRTLQRWENECRADSRKGSLKSIPRRLSEEERQKLLYTACSGEFKDLTPYEIVAILAEKRIYIASERTFYRILNAENMLHHRGNSKPCSKTGKPDELKATGPDQVWCWDITYLRTTIHGLYYYCYMIKDIWTKEIVGWEIHDAEDVDIAAEMFKKLKGRRKIRGVRLHSDNGNPMKGATMIMTLYNLGVIPSFSRPRVSNDSPYIESLFKTLKYTVGYPGQFRDIDHARIWMSDFVNWYNIEHRHSAIGYVTPAQRKSGDYKDIFKIRNSTMEDARLIHPERWGNRIRIWKANEEIYLNPSNETKEKLKQKNAA